jgi:hypothetical protein
MQHKLSEHSEKPKLYIFGWPSFLGGADTKLAHLLFLLRGHYDTTVVPNHAARLREQYWTRFLEKLRIKYMTFRHLPRKLQGIGLSLCNRRFFLDKIAHRVKERGLKIIWSSEMMWHHEGELEAVKQGVVDKVLYVSEFQKRYLVKGYGNLPSAIVGNYIDPRFFPFNERRHRTFAIGRLSRHDPAKYPEDFPVFYECLDLPDTRFRVMAWSKALARKYRWHRFDARWELLPPEAEPQVKFLHSLDLFVYPLGHTFKESWGRSTVEAMLTGCVPLVPAGHHFENLIVHGQSGFICADFLEYKEHAHRLCTDFDYHQQIARQCREHAVTRLCVAKDHLEIWREALR